MGRSASTNPLAKKLTERRVVCIFRAAPPITAAEVEIMRVHLDGPTTLRVQTFLLSDNPA